MDIIAAHREGLTEKLDQECADLAGRARDFGQRAMVLHHLYDHSLCGHLWALVEARQQMATDRALQRLETKVNRWWRGAATRAAAAHGLSLLRTALGEEAARRTAAAYRAYRMAGTPALGDLLGGHLAADHAERLVALHASRREGKEIDGANAEALALAVEADIGRDPNGNCAAAWVMVDATMLGRAARRALRSVALEQQLARQRRRGWAKLEQELRDDPYLPAAFRANPAQHFYALQHGLAERRRKEWVEGVGSDEALAA